VLGFLAWIWLVVVGQRVSRQASAQLLPLVTILGASLVLQLVLPLQAIILLLQMIVLASLASSSPSAAQVII
jgi:hypothetical protein